MTLVETLIFSEILKNILSKFTDIMFSKSILLFIVSIQYTIVQAWESFEYEK